MRSSSSFVLDIKWYKLSLNFPLAGKKTSFLLCVCSLPSSSHMNHHLPACTCFLRLPTTCCATPKTGDNKVYLVSLL